MASYVMHGKTPQYTTIIILWFFVVVWVMLWKYGVSSCMHDIIVNSHLFIITFLKYAIGMQVAVLSRLHSIVNNKCIIIIMAVWDL